MAKKKKSAGRAKGSQSKGGKKPAKKGGKKADKRRPEPEGGPLARRA